MDTGGFKKQMHKHIDWKWTSLAMAAIITALGISLPGAHTQGTSPQTFPQTPIQGMRTPGIIAQGSGISPAVTDAAVPKASIRTKQVPVTHAPAASEYDNKVVANVTDVLNLRAKPSLEGEIIGKCYRGAGGTVLEKKDGWTKIRSGGLEGWLNNEDRKSVV